MQASNGSIWITWQTFRYRGVSQPPDIIFGTYTNNVLGPLVRVTSSFYNTTPALVQLQNGTIMLFYSQRQTNVFNLYYVRYSPDAQGHITCLSNPPCPVVRVTAPVNFNDTSPAPTLARDGTVWLFWQRSNQTCVPTCTQTKQVYYKTLTNGIWSSAETRITTSANSVWSWLPSSTTTKDGRIWLAWSKGGQSSGTSVTSSFISRKYYNGVSWSSEFNVSSTPSGFGDQRASIIQDRNGTIWVFWARTSLSTPAFVLYNRFSTDNGVSWSAEQQMTNEPAGIDSQQPGAVQAYSGSDRSIHVFYSSDRNTITNDYDIYQLASPSISPVHDIGITLLSPSDTLLYAGGLASVGQSSNTNIGITVFNYGDQIENVQVTLVISNTTTTNQGIKTFNLGPLSQSIGSRASFNFFFVWNTTGAAPARYTINATASAIGVTETQGNQGDNTLVVKNKIQLIPWGDIDQNGQVTITDLSVVYFDYGFTPATPSKWNPFADINNNGIIDIIDVGVVTNNFGINT